MFCDCGVPPAFKVSYCIVLDFSCPWVTQAMVTEGCWPEGQHGAATPATWVVEAEESVVEGQPQLWSEFRSPWSTWDSCLQKKGRLLCLTPIIPLLLFEDKAQVSSFQCGPPYTKAPVSIDGRVAINHKSLNFQAQGSFLPRIYLVQ